MNSYVGTFSFFIDSNLCSKNRNKPVGSTNFYWNFQPAQSICFVICTAEYQIPNTIRFWKLISKDNVSNMFFDTSVGSLLCVGPIIIAKIRYDKRKKTKIMSLSAKHNARWGRAVLRFMATRVWLDDGDCVENSQQNTHEKMDFFN